MSVDCSVCLDEGLCGAAGGGRTVEMPILPDPELRMRFAAIDNNPRSIRIDARPSAGRTAVAEDMGRGDNVIETTRDEESHSPGNIIHPNGRSGEQRAQKEAGITIGIRDRIGCYTWTWFTMTMATGGIANVLHSIPFRSNWLYGVGLFFFLFNIVLFIVNCVMISLRFNFFPQSFRESFGNQRECLFVPASIVSVAIILTNTSQYALGNAGVWLQTTMMMLFWAYAAVSVFGSCFIYLVLWSTQAFPIQNMTPIWIFPAYPLLLTAPFASNLIEGLPISMENSLDSLIAIAFGSMTLQGMGFLVSLNIYGAFIYRLMTQKLPQDMLKPGMFVSVGPSGFTAAGFLQLGSLIFSKALQNSFLGYQDAAAVLKIVLSIVGLWLWGLCIWFFLVSVGAHWEIIWPRGPRRRIHFDMTWYSFVFPNTALITATQAVGETFESPAIQIVGTVMAGLLVVVWLCVFVMMVRALIMRRLLWPEENEEDNIARRINDSENDVSARREK